MKLYNAFLARLSRVTTSSVVIQEVDGLRFLAIMPVVFLHLTTNYLRVSSFEQKDIEQNFFFMVLNRGGMGVNVFFAISGFVLALPFVKYYLSHGKKVELKRYYWRRLTRLEPPFVISMLMFFCAWLVLGKYSFDQLLNSLWASLVYVHYIVFGKWSIINPISWSLETEVQFYVLAPLIFCVFLLKSQWLRQSLLVGVCIIGIWLASTYHSQLVDYHLAKSIVVYFPFFAVGILMADSYLKNPEYFKRKSHAWDVLGGSGLILVYVFHYAAMWFAPVMQCFGVALVFMSAFKGIMLNKIFTKKEISVIGGMCYSIYLLHYGLLFFFMNFTGNILVSDYFIVNYCIQLVIILPIVLLISALFFILFEKPFMYTNWYKNFPKTYLSYITGKGTKQ